MCSMSDLRELTRGGENIAVEPQVFDLLIYLVENRDRVVTKDDLIETIWNGRIVSESTLTSRINAARKAVGDSGKDQAVIRTIARKGFRFVGDVSATAGTAPRAASVRRSAAAPQAACARQLRESPLRQQQPPLDRPAIAVLPFVNISGESEQEYFSEGISEDIITALSKLRWFYVVARNSSFVYKGKAVHLKQIGEELGVGYVVEGSRAQGWQPCPHHRPADRCRHRQPPLGRTLRPRPGGCVRRAGRDHAGRGGGDRAAALCGREFPQPAQDAGQHGRLGPGDARAAALLARDPAGQSGGAGAAGKGHRGRSRLWPGAQPAGGLPYLRGPYGLGGNADDRSGGGTAALAAIRADSEDAWAHYALACVYLFDRRFEDSIAEFELALQLNPNFSPARGLYGVALSYRGRWEEGDRAAREALRLSPRDPFAAIYCGVAAYCQYVGKNYDEAIRLCREALRERSDFVGAHRVLTAARSMAGRRDVAKAALQDLRVVQPNISLGMD